MVDLAPGTTPPPFFGQITHKTVINETLSNVTLGVFKIYPKINI